MPLLNGLILRFSLLLLVVTCLLPAQSLAEPATKLYVGHHARLTAQIPRDWTVDSTGTFDYIGADGFVDNQPVTGQTLDEACSNLTTSPHFDDLATVVDTTWSGQAACRIEGQNEGAAVAALVVPHPHPFEIFEVRFAYASVFAAPDDLDAIVATLDFSPARVTPEAYLSSVLDIMEARAYWAAEVDWELARREMLVFVDGLPTVEMAQGSLLTIVRKLQTAGDNHSRVRLPHQTNALAESDGFGMLVGGQQVLVVFPEGPADRAGVRAGDIIEVVDGRPFLPTQMPIDPAALAAPDPANRWGESAQLTLRRPGGPGAITVTVEYGPYSRYVPPTGHRLPGAIGYIELYHFSSPGKQTDYAATANGIIAAIVQSPTCGWVVDLRLNGGGSYSPMISGIGPILGNGTFVGWRRADGSQSWVAYEDGRIIDDGKQISDYLGSQLYALQRPIPPVAVLIGPVTGSSGEVTTLAFVGRPTTRLFGEPTAGATTAVLSYPLFDGAILGLAESAMTDRTGATHMAGVEPDERIAIDWTAYGTADDPVLAGAMEWLNQQPACASETSMP